MSLSLSAETSPVPPAPMFDEDGFLLEPAAWTIDLARDLALGEGIARLDYEHWRVLHFIRDYHARFGAAPLIRRVCRRSGLARSDVKRLFASCRSAWRIAGLPHPGEEAKTYMN